MKTAWLAALLALHASTAGLTGSGQRPPAPGIEINVLSTRADRVSGGDVLIEIVAPGERGSAMAVPFEAALNGRDVSTAFHAASGSGSWVGLLTGLAVGRNTIKATARTPDLRGASLDVTNYPITGPIVSGPHVRPFVCQEP
jgi:Tannase-like family of unknown function (DUF6351)